MRIAKLLIFLATIILPFQAWSQNSAPTDTLLDHLTGKWLLKGTMAGQKVEHYIIAEWVLGHQYFQIKEISLTKQPNGQPTYDAIVYITFNKLHNNYDCLWLDNTSNVGLSNGIIAHAKKQPNQLALIFKFNEHSYFHTTFSYNATNSSWRLVMTNYNKDKGEQFANAIISKLK